MSKRSMTDTDTYRTESHKCPSRVSVITLSTDCKTYLGDKRSQDFRVGGHCSHTGKSAIKALNSVLAKWHLLCYRQLRQRVKHDDLCNKTAGFQASVKMADRMSSSFHFRGSSLLCWTPFKDKFWTQNPKLLPRLYPEMVPSREHGIQEPTKV